MITRKGALYESLFDEQRVAQYQRRSSAAINGLHRIEDLVVMPQSVFCIVEQGHARRSQNHSSLITHKELGWNPVLHLLDLCAQRGLS